MANGKQSKNLLDTGGFFRGYVLTKNKACIEPFKGIKNLKSYDEVKDKDEFAGILAENIVLIDVDNQEESEILFKIVKHLKLKCKVIRTTRGKHFYFLNNNSLTSNKGNATLFLGISADIKLGSRNSYAVLKFKGQEREIIYDIDDGEEYQTLPKFLRPSNLNLDFLNLEEGDGRNQELFNYILHLQSNDFTKDECKECITLINDFVLSEPLPERELRTILRNDSFKAPIFYQKNQFLFDKYAIFLKNNANIKKINGRLHLYKDGIYVDGKEEIEREMIKNLPRLNRSKRSEVFDYLNLLVEDNINLTDANLIPFKNGILDISSGELLDPNPSLIVRNKINYNYNPNAYDELLDKTLNKLSCHDKEVRSLIEEMVGYCFFPRNELGKAFILTGGGSNGKSTLLSLIETILGLDNISSLDLGELGDRFKTAELFGKLANLGDDIGDDFVANPAIFKKLVTGERVNVEKKGQDPFEFNNYSKFIFSANNIPRIKDRTGAVQRRLIIVPFNASFTTKDPDFDPYIKYKLLSENSLEYLIKLGVDGLLRVLKSKKFTSSKKVEKALDTYEKENNPILLFFDEYEKDFFLETPVNDCYKSYGVFCQENGFLPMSKVEFGKNVCSFYGLVSKSVRKNGKVIRYYVPDL